MLRYLHRHLSIFDFGEIFGVISLNLEYILAIPLATLGYNLMYVFNNFDDNIYFKKKTKKNYNTFISELFQYFILFSMQNVFTRKKNCRIKKLGTNLITVSIYLADLAGFILPI